MAMPTAVKSSWWQKPRSLMFWPFRWKPLATSQSMARTPIVAFTLSSTAPLAASLMVAATV